MIESGFDTHGTAILSESKEIEKIKNRILADGGQNGGYNYFNFKQINFGYEEPFLKVIALTIQNN